MNATHCARFCLVALLVQACGSEDAGSLTGGRPGGRPGGPGDPSDPSANADPASPAVPIDPTLSTAPGGSCTGRDYLGFDKVSLTADRQSLALGIDRGRVKSYAVLLTELPRILGNTPASLAGAAATFGAPPARWYEEPQAGAVALQTVLTVAFDGCLTYTATGAEYASTPTATSAGASCAAFARKFWSRAPTTTEIQACVDVAVSGSATEPLARRRWAYACASVLTSAGFLTY